MTTTKENLAALSNATLMEAIAAEKRHMALAAESRGPISARRYIEGRIYPELIALYEERNRRMNARRNVR